MTWLLLLLYAAIAVGSSPWLIGILCALVFMGAAGNWIFRREGNHHDRY